MFFWTIWNQYRRWERPRGVIDFEPLHTYIVSPQEFIDLYEREPDNIESVEPIPGKLGTDNFGSFVVRRKRPIYVPSIEDPVFSK